MNRRILSAVGGVAVAAALIGGGVSAVGAQTPPTTTAPRSPLGVQLELRNGKVTVVSVTAGSPAEQAGLRANDEIVSINGQAVTSIDQIPNLLRSAAGSGSLSIVVNRGGQNQTLTINRPAGDQNRQGGGRRGGPGGFGMFGQGALADIPADQRFDHLRGGTFSFTDKDGKLMTIQSIPGKIGSVDATNNRITVTKNDGTSATYRVDANTKYGPNGALANLKASDKVTVVVNQATADLAVAVMKLPEPGTQAGPNRPNQGGANPGNARPQRGPAGFNPFSGLTQS